MESRTSIPTRRLRLEGIFNFFFGDAPLSLEGQRAYSSRPADPMQGTDDDIDRYHTSGYREAAKLHGSSTIDAHRYRRRAHWLARAGVPIARDEAIGKILQNTLPT
jgi:hypothetical protein